MGKAMMMVFAQVCKNEDIKQYLLFMFESPLSKRVNSIHKIE